MNMIANKLLNKLSIEDNVELQRLDPSMHIAIHALLVNSATMGYSYDKFRTVRLYTHSQLQIMLICAPQTLDYIRSFRHSWLCTILELLF